MFSDLDLIALTADKASNDDDVSYFKILSWTVTIVSLLSSIAFFLSFYRIKPKTQGLYMIMVLDLYDIIFPLLAFSTIPESTEEVKLVIVSIAVGLYQLIMNWTAAISIFTYLTLSQKKILKLRVFMPIAFLICLVLAAPSTFIILDKTFDVQLMFFGKGYCSVLYSLSATHNNKFGFFMFFYFLGMFTPVAITTFCYYKVYFVLKNLRSSPYERLNMKPERVLLYPAVPIICFTPEFIISMYCTFNTGWFPSTVPGLILSFLHRSWGFWNLMIYWFYRPMSQSLDTSQSDQSSSLM